MLPHQGMVIVVGSNGRVGHAIVRRLSGKYRVVAMDSSRPQQPVLTAEHFVTDLANNDRIRATLREIQEKFGNRLISLVDVNGYPETMLRAVKEQGFETQQFLFASTARVHQASMSKMDRINEISPLRPRSLDADAKLHAEAYLLENRDDVPIVILRLAEIYDDLCHFEPLAREIRSIHERKLSSRVLPGDLGDGHAVVHVDDVVDAVSRAVDRRRELPQETILLIGEPTPISEEELQNRIGVLIHGKEWKALRLRALRRMERYYALDTDQARHYLGWQPSRSLLDTLPLMISMLKANPEAWYRENGLEAPEQARPTHLKAAS